MENEQLQANALDVGLYLNDGLRELGTRHESIGDVRGDGLFKAVEMVTNRETREPATLLAPKIVNALRERRILAGSTGIDDNIIKLRPPMVFSIQNADQFLQIFDEVLATS
jgi:4-aminobutyrate aminotransferase-like enzyme